MTKPPATPPSSDIDGVHEDEKKSVDAANAAGQTAEDVDKAEKENAGRPPSNNDRNRDDRSR